jgi:PAS domain S-box-containing protein
MQLALETQVLYELALSIGESSELTPMLRHTLSELLRLTNGSGALVMQFGEGPMVGEMHAAPHTACRLPRNLERHVGYQEFAREWPPEALYATLAARGEHLPLTVTLLDGAAHAFLLPKFGYLVLFRRHGALAESFLRAFGPLARKLGSTARSCVLEEELRRQSVRLELATSTASIGVWQFDIATSLLTWDSEMFRIFGITPQEFRGTSADFLSRVHPDDLDRVIQHLATLADHSGRFEIEYAIVRPDGARRQVYATGRVQRDGRGVPLAIVGVNFDITSRKETEDALRRARDLAEATNLARSSFIANMSHELRTPLNGIIGMTELALQSGSNETQHEYLRVARSSADSLLTILNDILDFSKIDAGEMQVEHIPFSLPVVVTETLKSLAVRAQQKQLEIVLDLPAELPTFSLGDPGRLRQILLNLCDNALKFTASGEIVVRVRAVDVDDGQWVTIEVQDSGIGIAPEKLEQIFDAFQQVDASITRRFGGTGLGLSISRRLATLMGGDLTVRSAPGTGSTFTLTLPLPTVTMPREPTAPLHARWEGCRVLIVDGDDAGRTTRSLWLRYWGFVVAEADAGTDGLRAAEEAHTKGHPFDAVILDAVLPGLDGFAVAEAIASRRLVPPGRLVMVASEGRRGDAVRCREFGITGFLSKPATPSELRDVLARVLQSPPGGDHPFELITRQLIDERPHTRRVLLVEDNPVNQAVAEGMLLTLGYEVVVAQHGQEALDRLDAEQFDLVFMDMQMPVLDGVATTREIRRREGTARHIPIVAMTANAMANEREQCLAAGMDDHLAKPVRLQALQDALQRYAPR